MRLLQFVLSEMSDFTFLIYEISANQSIMNINKFIKSTYITMQKHNLSMDFKEVECVLVMFF